MMNIYLFELFLTVMQGDLILGEQAGGGGQGIGQAAFLCYWYTEKLQKAKYRINKAKI